MPSPAGMSRNDDASRAIKTVLASLEDSKAENIVSIDIQGKSSLGDYMVVASGRSHRHVAPSPITCSRRSRMPASAQARVEGLAGADWVLIDSGDIIVHVFRPEIREFYNSRSCGRRRISRKRRSTDAGPVPQTAGRTSPRRGPSGSVVAT